MISFFCSSRLIQKYRAPSTWIGQSGEAGGLGLSFEGALSLVVEPTIDRCQPSLAREAVSK
jgi:hypothetical protein